MKKLFNPGDKFINDVGELEYLGQKSPIKGIWRCFCGNIWNIPNSVIISQKTKSCGCYNKKIIDNKTKDNNIIYLYRLYGHIMSKCYNKNDKSYDDYGGRGIYFFNDWKSNSIKFVEDIISEIKHRPTNKYSLDRIDNNKGYEPGNLRWATASEQARNRRSNKLITINNETKTIADWADIANIDQSLLSRRLKYGCNEQNLLLPTKTIKNINNTELDRQLENLHDSKNYLYRLWNNIKNRCYNENNIRNKNYLDRGITIQDSWCYDFDKFKNDLLNEIGHRQTNKHQLDRINNDLGYQLGNLRWANNKTNGRNKSNNKLIMINNETKTLAEWVEISGLNRATISARIKKRYSQEQLLSPLNKQKLTQEQANNIRKEYESGEYLSNIAKKYKIGLGLITDVIRKRGAYEQ